MTCDTKKSIPFRLIKILESLDSLKASRKEFISIAKVLLKLAKEEAAIQDFTDNIFGDGKNHYQLLGVTESFEDEELKIAFDNNNAIKQELLAKSASARSADKVRKEIEQLTTAYETLLDPAARVIYDRELQINKIVKEQFTTREINDWKLTMKEKDLLFTLRVVVEIRKRGFEFTIGLDFNTSSLNNFSFINGKMLIPFTAITGVGTKVAEKIIAYRTTNGRINDWKEDLKTILNKKNFEQVLNLEDNGLLFS